MTDKKKAAPSGMPSGIGALGFDKLKAHVPVAVCPLTGFTHSGAHHGEGCKGCDDQHEYLMNKHLGVDVRATPEAQTEAHCFQDPAAVGGCLGPGDCTCECNLCGAVLAPAEAQPVPRCTVCGASRMVGGDGRPGVCTLVPGRDGKGGCPDPLRDARRETASASPMVPCATDGCGRPAVPSPVPSCERCRAIQDAYEEGLRVGESAELRRASASAGNHESLKEMWDLQCSQVADICTWLGIEGPPDTWALRDALIALGLKDAAKRSSNPSPCPHGYTTHLVGAGVPCTGSAQRDLVEALAKFIVRLPATAYQRDHACSRCVPGGEIVTAGFTCAVHRAIDVVTDCASPASEDNARSVAEGSRGTSNLSPGGGSEEPGTFPDCGCTDGTDPDEPADRGFICPHDPAGHSSSPTCVHLDRRCPSWKECATRTAMDSGKRAMDLMAHAAEVTRLQDALRVIADGRGDYAWLLRVARTALERTPLNIVGLPAEFTRNDQEVK